MKIKKCHKEFRNQNVSWLEAGSNNKEIMFFIHGFPDDADIWSAQLNYFSKDYHVIAPNLTSRNNYKAVLFDFIQILDSVDPSHKKKINLIGHDIGTLYSWLLSSYLKDRLKSVAIINGSHHQQFFRRLKSNYKQALKSWYMLFFIMPVLPQLTLKILKKPFNSLLKASDIPKNQIDKFTNNEINSHELVKHYNLLFRASVKLLRKKEPKLDVPVLALSSLFDKYVEPANLNEIEMLTNKPTVRIIEGGHWVQVENSDRVNRLLSKFIQA